GLDPRAATNAAWTVGVPRFAALFKRLEMPATFYCVAADLEVEDNRDRLRALAEEGFEIGNHSWRHNYRLTRLPASEQRAELTEGRARLEAASGVSVVGFRAPGYHSSGGLQSHLRESGHRYESSAFPCVPYYLAKASVMGWLRLRGRASGSLLGSPKILLAPRAPYRAAVDDPYRRGEGLPHYPVSVCCGVPLIGTTFTALGTRLSRQLAKLSAQFNNHLTVEFHAADLLSIEDDQLDPALSKQPDLRVSVTKKEARFTALLTKLKESHRFERLDQLAGRALL
ncbi:MAG: polysaccharide deacetylase family protein, partial [Myxococcota bacterium]|nr:polysaccharide deacetylase family protein [Myxococcota bacterium]